MIQVSPVLDCSGYALYISQTEMEGKISHIIGEYTYVSALKPKSVIFTLFVPATGSIYWSETYPGNSIFQLSDTGYDKLITRYLYSFFICFAYPKCCFCWFSRRTLILIVQHGFAPFRSRRKDSACIFRRLK